MSESLEAQVLWALHDRSRLSTADEVHDTDRRGSHLLSEGSDAFGVVAQRCGGAQPFSGWFRDLLGLQRPSRQAAWCETY